MKSGNPDTSTSRYFVLSGRSAVVSDYTANLSQTKKIVNLPGSGFFFHGGKKKKNPEFRKNLEVAHPWLLPIVAILHEARPR